MKKQTIGMLEATAASALFGFSYLMCSIAFEYITPEQLLCVRYVLAFAVMTLLLLFRLIRVNYRGKPVKKLCLMGLLYPVIGFLCDNYGTYYTSSAMAGSIMAAIPVVTMVVSLLVLRERVNRRQVLCALLAVAGAIFISAGNFADGTSLNGVLLLLGAALTNSLFTVLNKKYAAIFTVEEKSYFQIGMGAVSFALLALPGILRGEFDRAVWKTPLLWMAICYLGILVSVVALLLLNDAIRKITPTQSAILSNLVPVISVVSGVLILHDAFTPLQMLGVVIVVISAGGVVMGGVSAQEAQQ